MPNYVPLEFPPGMVRSATSRSTPGRWYDGSLVRWRDGVLTPIGGWQRIDVDLLSTTARTIYGWVASNDARQIAIGCDGGFYSLWEERLLDITPDDFVPDEATLAVGGFGTWDFGEGDYGTGREDGEPDDFLVCNTISLDNFGIFLLGMAQTDGRLLVYDPRIGPEEKLKEVVAETGKSPVPVASRAMLVSPERFVIVIGADGHSRRVAWCGREDFYDWDYANVSGTAGILDLDASSPLIALKTVRDGTLIFSNSEVWILRYIGTDLVHGATKLEENTSLICPYAVAAFGGKAMWWTRTGFKFYDSGYIKPIACDVMDFLIRDVDRTWERLRTHAVVNNVYSEVSWFYVSTSGIDGVPDSYVTYNYDTGVWWTGKLSRTAGIPVLINHDPILAGPNGELYRHEYPGKTAFSSEGAGRIFARSGAFEPVAGAMCTLNQVLPDSESGFNSTTFSFTTRMTPEADEKVYGPYSARPDGYLDCRFTARQIELEVEQGKDGHWTLGKPEFDAKPRGRR